MLGVVLTTSERAAVSDRDIAPSRSQTGTRSDVVRNYAQLRFSNSCLRLFFLSHGILPGVVVLPGTVDDGIVVL